MCGAGVVWSIASRALGAVLVRSNHLEAGNAEAAAAKKGMAFYALANLTVMAARKKAKRVQFKVLHAANLPSVALLVAVVQTVGMLGDVTVVANVAPALEAFANALGWASLMLPLPKPLNAIWFVGNETSASDMWDF